MGSYCTRGTSNALITCTGSVRREVPHRALITICACSLVILVDDAHSAWQGAGFASVQMVLLRWPPGAQWVSRLAVILQPVGTGRCCRQVSGCPVQDPGWPPEGERQAAPVTAASSREKTSCCSPPRSSTKATKALRASFSSVRPASRNADWTARLMDIVGQVCVRCSSLYTPDSWGSSWHSDVRTWPTVASLLTDCMSFLAVIYHNQPSYAHLHGLQAGPNGRLMEMYVTRWAQTSRRFLLRSSCRAMLL